MSMYVYKQMCIYIYIYIKNTVASTIVKPSPSFFRGVCFAIVSRKKASPKASDKALKKVEKSFFLIGYDRIFIGF